MQRPRKSPIVKQLALTLTFAMLLGRAITATAAPAYPDISGPWGETAIEKWSSYDVLHGNDLGTFEPDGELDVTQLAQILVNTFGYTESYTGSLSGYSSTWGEEAVRKAVAAGAIEAGEAALPLTRELAAKIVAKAFGISPVSGASKFSDDYAISAEYKPYAAALGKAGIFNGNDYGEFMPLATFGRAQIMQALDNAVTDLVKENKAAESSKSVIINKGGVTLTEGTIEGDLIIAQGVGDGEVTLDGVTIKGRLVILGAGSVHIKGKSGVSNVVADKTFGQPARVAVESADAAVGTVTIVAESKATVATTNNAAVSKVTIAPKTQVSATGELTDVTTAAAATVTISAKVETLAVETKATVTVSSGATVAAATIEASDVKLSGAGKVTAVTVTADAKTGVEVRTSGTKVTVDAAAGAVTTSSGKIEPGKTATTGSSSSSGGDGGSYINNPPALTFGKPELTGVFENTENVNEMLARLWSSDAASTVQGIEGLSQVFSASGNVLTVNFNNVTDGLRTWVSTQWGGSSVPVKVTVSNGTAKGAADPNWDNSNLIWVDLAALSSGTQVYDFELTNGGKAEYKITGILNIGAEDTNVTTGQSFTVASGQEVTIPADKKLEVEGEGKLIVEGDLTVKGKLTVESSSTLEVTGAVTIEDTATVSGNLNLNGGTLDVAENATITFSETTVVKGDGIITVADGGKVVGTSYAKDFWDENADATIVYGSGAIAMVGTVEFIGKTGIVQIEKGGTVTQSKDGFTLTGAATVATGKTLSNNEDDTFDIQGTLTVEGNLEINGSLVIADGGIVAVASEYAGTIAINGALVIADGGMLDASGATNATNLFNALKVKSAAELESNDDEEGVVLNTDDGATITLYLGAAIKLATDQKTTINGALSGAGVSGFVFEEVEDESDIYTLVLAEDPTEEP
jgi:hypothetical protein